MPYSPDVPLTLAAVFAPAALVAAIAGTAPRKAAEAPDARSAHVVATSEVEAGRYLAGIGGCNDCHTLGYEDSHGTTPEQDRLTGGLPWRGPWGTSFPANLRLLAAERSADEWVTATKRTGLPPMPWLSLHNMHEQDLRAIHAYLRHLGPRGTHAPAALPPGGEPEGPYIDLTIRNLPAK